MFYCTSPRNNGLDNLRSIAIISVFIHNFWYINPHLSFGLLFPSVRDNVTLPPLWKLVTFTTNILLQTGTGLSYTWSLCVEEQFYFALPFIILILSILRLKWVIWSSVLLFIIGGMLLRYYFWNKYIGYSSNYQVLNGIQFANYQTSIYFFTLCRLDELIIGIVLAFIKNFYSKIWWWLISRGYIVEIGGVCIAAISCYIFLYYHYSLYATIFGYPLMGISFGGLIISAFSNKSALSNIKIPFTRNLALMSYAIYLSEKPTNKITMDFIKKNNITNNSFLSFAICAVVSLLTAYILYTVVELYFLKLRDRKFPMLYKNI